MIINETTDVVLRAKKVRKALKRFPNTEFRVRCSRYSLGSHVTVTWTDGPCVARVENTVGHWAELDRFLSATATELGLDMVCEFYHVDNRNLDTLVNTGHNYERLSTMVYRELQDKNL